MTSKKNIVWQKGKINRQDRWKILGQEGQVIWFTGLSGAGKSTIAIELEKGLVERGKIVYRLDGDNIRYGLNKDLNFTKEDRFENIRRVAEAAALFQDAGIITLASFISPYREMRDFARNCIGQEYFSEIYVKADLDTCISRDPKGLYKMAEQGLIDNFTGISAPYEEPRRPDLILNTTILSVDECILALLKLLNIE